MRLGVYNFNRFCNKFFFVLISDIFVWNKLIYVDGRFKAFLLRINMTHIYEHLCFYIEHFCAFQYIF